MKPLIILGNGKSLKDFDLNTISDCDTFGLNGAYIRFQELNWFPKYYGNFIGINTEFWKPDEIVAFVKENYLKCDKFFFAEEDNSVFNNLSWLEGVEQYDRIQKIKKIRPVNIDIDSTKYSWPLYVDCDIARSRLLEKYTPEEVFWRISTRLETQPHVFFEKLNSDGIYKFFDDVELTENDYIRLPRFNIGWILPESFNNFLNCGGNAGYMACLTGYLLGYKKIILLGFDFNFEATNNVVDVSKTFWFNNYFNNKEYNIKNRICKNCENDTMYKMQLQSFELLKGLIKHNNLDLDVVNCTEDSKLDIFRKSTLEKEL